jgi:hypothetical protein
MKKNIFAIATICLSFSAMAAVTNNKESLNTAYRIEFSKLQLRDSTEFDRTRNTIVDFIYLIQQENLALVSYKYIHGNLVYCMKFTTPEKLQVVLNSINMKDNFGPLQNQFSILSGWRKQYLANGLKLTGSTQPICAWPN